MEGTIRSIDHFTGPQAIQRFVESTRVSSPLNLQKPLALPPESTENGKLRAEIPDFLQFHHDVPPPAPQVHVAQALRAYAKNR